MKEESKNKAREEISAYLDDALPQTELDALVDLRQEQRLGIASRYQMIGEVLRGQMSDASMVDVRVQVREALEHEDVRQEDIKREDTKREDMKLDENKEAGRRRSMFDLSWFSPAWYKPVGGLAVAASVAMIMVITVNHEDTASDSNLIAESNTENTTINMAINNELVANSVATFVADETRTPRLVDQSPINLDTYLAEHAEFAAQDTMQGWMPYARAVSYEAE